MITTKPKIVVHTFFTSILLFGEIFLLVQTSNVAISSNNNNNNSLHASNQLQFAGAEHPFNHNSSIRSQQPVAQSSQTFGTISTQTPPPVLISPKPQLQPHAHSLSQHSQFQPSHHPQPRPQQPTQQPPQSSPHVQILPQQPHTPAQVQPKSQPEIHLDPITITAPVTITTTTTPASIIYITTELQSNTQQPTARPSNNLSTTFFTYPPEAEVESETETAPTFIIHTIHSSSNQPTTPNPLPIINSNSTFERLILSSTTQQPSTSTTSHLSHRRPEGRTVVFPTTSGETLTSAEDSNAPLTNVPQLLNTTSRIATTTPPFKNVQFLRPNSHSTQLSNACKTEADCNNHGVCINSTCFCTPGFTAEKCSFNVDECRQVNEPCLNGGTCIDGENTYTCSCPPGFKGDSCEDAINLCLSLPCQNNATCINHRTDFSCQCLAGFEGKKCERNTDDCLKNPCKNNGTCTDLTNDYRCDCGDLGFTGKNCDIDIDDCAKQPCGFGTEKCIDKTGDYECICFEGFKGKNCEIDINECAQNPCENNGTCIEKSLSFRSELPTHMDLKDQNVSMNPAQFAGYTCECGFEYYGDRCEDKKKCFTKSASELCNHDQAECVNVANSYECLISASFDGSGERNATYKVSGEFKMKEIYIKYRSLTGGVLMSFDTTNPLSPTNDLVLNRSGLYLSGAPIKGDVDFKFDEYLDGTERTLTVGLDIPTEIKSITLARRSNDDTLPPFKGCLMVVRLNGQLVPLIQQASGLNNSFEYSDGNLDLGSCRTCFKNDCQNSGHCDDSSERCVCPATFTGPFCENDVNECETISNARLCLNNGTCENLIGGWRCNCKEGYKGKTCSDISDWCRAKQPCLTGTCKNVNQSIQYFCECPSSHIGKRCERKRDCNNECQQAQCINNVTCACLPGIRFERNLKCEYVSSCRQVEGDLCQNGGQCKDIDTGGYTCICQEPYYGSVCQYLIDKPQFDVLLLIAVTCIGLLFATCAVVSLVIFKSVRKARATRGTYSPSSQEKFGNSASDILKPPPEERLI